MSTRYLPRFAGTCAVFFSTAVLGCGDGETLLHSQQFTVAPDAPLLLRIDQNGTDLVIAVDNAAGTTLFNHPDDRNGFELVYLQSADGSTQQVCVHSTFRNPDIRIPHRITELDISGWSDATLATLQRFSAASSLWASANPAARAQALQEYEALSALDASAFPFRDNAHLYAVRAALLASRFDTALQYVDSFPSQSELTAQYPHLLPWYRGLALLRQRKYEDAVLALERAASLSTQQLDSAEIRNLHGEALLLLNRDEEGASEIEAALAASGSDHSVLARVHNNRGYVLLKRAFAGNLDPAEAQQLLHLSIDEHLLARAFAVNAGETAEQMSIDDNLGVLYERANELRKAQYHYREALRLMETAGDVYLLRVLIQNLGSLHQRLGDYPKSRAYLEQALELTEQAGESTARVNCLLGTTYRLMGALPQALAIHETCRALAAEHEDQQVLIEALTELAEDYSLAELSDRNAGADDNMNAQAAWSAIGTARALLNQHMPEVLAAGRVATEALDARADNLCTAQQAPASGTDAALTEGSLFVATRVLNRHALLARRFATEEQALDDLRLAAGVLDKTRYTGQLDTLETGLKVYRALGNKDFARACGERALKLVERLHEDLEAERNGPAWSAKTHEIYVALADMLLDEAPAGTDNETTRAAFAVAERAMGISLRQHLSLPPNDTRASEDAQLRAALNTLADRHAALSAEQKARLLPVSYYHQQDLMERSRQNAQDRVAIPRALQSGEIQARLGEGQTVLYYYVGTADAWLFKIDARTFSVHNLGPATTLAALLAAVEQDLRSANGAPAVGLRDLSAFLLPADLQLTGAQELLIVPHRDLYKIPFAALTRAQAGDARVLIEDFAVKTTPSLTAYFMDKPGAAEDRSADLAVFADPLFNTTDLRSSALGPTEEPEELQSWSATLERLPYTELEANNLRAVFRPENTLDFLGNRATLANLTSAPVRNARILHIATHGYFHSTSSDNVGLVLSAINENNERVPGFVTLTELFGHRFNNELVVISGCDTAMGMQLAGEGMMGVTRGFLAQGARHVISTLWPVSDRASAQFMALFYTSLHQLGNVAEALRAAQLELKALPEFRHPYYWAPYVLTTVSPVDVMRFNADVALTR
jgi:CHAT domain-containing protein